jgi:hypothetical protein
MKTKEEMVDEILEMFTEDYEVQFDELKAYVCEQQKAPADKRAYPYEVLEEAVPRALVNALESLVDLYGVNKLLGRPNWSDGSF